MVVFRRVVLMAAAAQALPAIWLATLQVEQGISPLALLKFLFTHDQRLDLAMTILSNGSSFFTFMTICTINALLCALALLLEKIVFTRLRATELQLSFQSSVNFVILRAMAIHAGVSLHEHDDQAWHWLFWAIVCGWGTALQAMSHARLTYLFTSPHADRVAVGKVLAVVVLAWATTLLVLSWTVAGPLHSVQWYLLWCFDFLMLTIKSANTLLTWLYYRQSITTCEGHVVEERRYHSSLVIGLLLLLLRFLLCSSVLAINDFAIGPINIVAFFQCKGIVQSAQARLKAHGQYLLATRRLEQMFSVMSASLIPEHTRTAGCPICRDDFGDDACSLPCRHAFHQMCITRWLQQQPSCPTCRLQLDTAATHANHNRTPTTPIASTTPAASAGDSGGVSNADTASSGPSPPSHHQHHHHHHHHQHGYTRRRRRRSVVAAVLDTLAAAAAIRILPALAHVLRGPRQQQHHDGRADNDDNDYGDGGDGFWAFNQDDLEAEVARVLAVFPHAPAGAVRADVSVTGSAAATSNNILEGRVPAVALRSDTYRGGGEIRGGGDNDDTQSQLPPQQQQRHSNLGLTSDDEEEFDFEPDDDDGRGCVGAGSSGCTRVTRRGRPRRLLLRTSRNHAASHGGGGGGDAVMLLSPLTSPTRAHTHADGAMDERDATGDDVGDGGVDDDNNRGGVCGGSRTNDTDEKQGRQQQQQQQLHVGGSAVGGGTTRGREAAAVTVKRNEPPFAAAAAAVMVAQTLTHTNGVHAIDTIDDDSNSEQQHE